MPAYAFGEPRPNYTPNDRYGALWVAAVKAHRFHELDPISYIQSLKLWSLVLFYEEQGIDLLADEEETPMLPNGAVQQETDKRKLTDAEKNIIRASGPINAQARLVGLNKNTLHHALRASAVACMLSESTIARLLALESSAIQLETKKGGPKKASTKAPPRRVSSPKSPPKEEKKKVTLPSLPPKEAQPSAALARLRLDISRLETKLATYRELAARWAQEEGVSL